MQYILMGYCEGNIFELISNRGTYIHPLSTIVECAPHMRTLPSNSLGPVTFLNQSQMSILVDSYCNRESPMHFCCVLVHSGNNTYIYTRIVPNG